MQNMTVASKEAGRTFLELPIQALCRRSLQVLSLSSSASQVSEILIRCPKLWDDIIDFFRPPEFYHGQSLGFCPF